MDFFEAQDNARRTSKWLLVVFIPVVAVIVAQNGHEDPAEAQVALDAGTALLGKWAVDARIDSKQELTVDTLDKSLDLLLQVNGKGRPQVAARHLRNCRP